MGKKLIQVDTEVDEELRKRAKGFESRNAVLRRLLNLPNKMYKSTDRPKKRKE